MSWMTLLISIICIAVVIFAFVFIQRMRMIWRASAILHDAEITLKNARRDSDAERRESAIRLKDELYKKRKEFDLELKRDRVELDRLQDKLNAKFDNLEKKDQQLEEIRRELQHRERNAQQDEEVIRSKEAVLRAMNDDLLIKLEQVSSMTREQARQILLDRLENEVRHTSQKWIQKIEEDARQIAKEKAIQTVVGAMQRYTADQVGPHSSGIIHLPNEEMKGRIIGKEGRNIKALNTILDLYW